jgi:phage gp37-like protein
MIQEIIDDIISALVGIPDVVGEIDQFAGDINELAKKPKRLPALWVVYDGADFEDRKVDDGVLVDHTMQFSVVLISKNHRSRADGAEACHGIIEAVRDRLIGLVIGQYGELWPLREHLIAATGPLFVYGLTYRLKTEYPPS